MTDELRAATVEERLDAIREDGLLRHMRTVGSAQGPRVDLDGRDVLLLCSNDYLSLASHPDVIAAAIAATERWGAGAGASRLISGNMEPHDLLEQELAAFHGTETALLLGSGYLANTGIVAALARRGDVVFSDELNHASIIDGCRLAGAETFVYRHRDLEHLAWALGRLPGHCGLIVTDGLFSMDGDVAQLGWLRELASRHGAMLMVDDAHAVGALGPGGRGSVAEAGLAGEVDVLVGTLGKALGSYGAYACVSREVHDLLVNTARPLIFSTALPPAAAAAASAALGIIASDPARIARLRANASTLRAALAAAGLEPRGAGAQIMPVAVGDPDRAVAICRRALDGGVYAQAIRPPTVPEGTSRLRLSVVADHEPEQLIDAASALADAFRAVSADGDWSIDLPDPEPGELRVERHGWRVVQRPGEDVAAERSGPERAPATRAG
ncbi:MAG TPA: 8-amino-7-oxononanoate synthase [Solirubrobacterales bacterium]|nr:8-amino-7-oxononanoate synthase [Solirubrobacterales bacterium]